MELGKIRTENTERMTAIVAGLVREGVTFEVTDTGAGTWLITLTGGF